MPRASRTRIDYKPQWTVTRRGGVTLRRRRRRWPWLLAVAMVVTALAYRHLPLSPVWHAAPPAGGERVIPLEPPAVATADAAHASDEATAAPAAGVVADETREPPGQKAAAPEPVGRAQARALPAAASTAPPPLPTAAPEPEPQWLGVTVKPGDSLSLVFARLGLPPRELHAIVHAGEPAAELADLRPGQRLRLRTADQRVLEIIAERDLFESIRVWRDGERFRAERLHRRPQTETVEASATIDDSLFLAGQAAGLSDNVIMQLAEVFAWDIDFIRDVRRGDRFAVVWERYLRDGRPAGDGPILAAQFVNRGHRHTAIRFVDDDGHADYYDADGNSLRKAFLRAPLNFTRISSRFNPRRRHPVLNRIRAHRGVDYAAPAGTPVRATGDGVVRFVGLKGGYGKMIVLQHGGIYSTAYAHLSRFARGMRRGHRVRQGQVIGYVGQTGLATGPHLHYEFRVRGVHRDPLKVRPPRAAPLPERYRERFRGVAAPLLARLQRLDEARLAAGDAAPAMRLAAGATP